jgi:hypothetical protein
MMIFVVLGVVFMFLTATVSLWFLPCAILFFAVALAGSIVEDTHRPDGG